MLLRPRVCLVTVRRVHEQQGGGGAGGGGLSFMGLCAPPLRVRPGGAGAGADGGGGGGEHDGLAERGVGYGVTGTEAHLMVTYVEDGAALSEVTKPATWFKANSRRAR